MKKKWIPYTFAAASVIAIATITQFIKPVTAHADVLTNPTHIGSPGSIDSTSDAIVGGDLLALSYDPGQIAGPALGKYRFCEDSIVIEAPDGSTTNAAIYHYDLTTQTANNGYLLIALSDVPMFVAALGGRLSFVEKQLQGHEITVTDQYGDTLTLVNFSTVVSESGAIFGTTQSTTVGQQITLTEHIKTSAPPVATSLTVSGA